MGLNEWFESQPEGAMTEMLWKTREKGTPVSWSTICRAKKGLPIGRRSAQIISRYTKRQVSYDSLRNGCAAEAQPAANRRGRKRRRAA
jgi:hypothetical protein